MECNPPVNVIWSPYNVPNGLYRRLFFKSCPGLRNGESLPRISCQGTNIQCDAQNLTDYQFVIQQPSNETEVPLFYPHALFGSAHLMIIGHDTFPLRAFGLLHLRNHVIRYRTFGIDSPWDMKCELTRQRVVEKGLEFDFDSTVQIDGEVVWRSISTYLKRGKQSGELEESPLGNLFPPLPEDAVGSGEFDVPHNIGRRYAKVTGDYNPIHVSSLAAKLFGFKRAIAHGMWSVARAIEQLPKVDGPVRHDVAFKGPMFVTSKATLKAASDGRFDLYCGSNPRPVIVGTYQQSFVDETFE